MLLSLKKMFFSLEKKLNQRRFKKEITRFIEKCHNIPKQYFPPYNKEIIDLLKKDKSIQELLREKAVQCILDGWSVPEEYKTIMSTESIDILRSDFFPSETLRIMHYVLKKRIIENIEKYGTIPEDAIFIETKTLQEILKGKECLQQIKKGENILDTCLEFMTNETVHWFRTNAQEVLKEGMLKNIKKYCYIPDIYILGL